MSDATETLAAIRSMPRDALVERWQQTFGHPPPKHIQASFMQATLAWRVQLDLQAKAGAPVNLARLGRSLRQAKSPPKLAPGARLVREWNGQTHTVTILEGGCEYRGQRYRSLSAIAREITGTQWSGPDFFGVKR